MSAEDIVPSAPLAADIDHPGGRIFERVRRETVESRRCAPCDNSWVAVDRIVHDGRTGFLFHRHHDCVGSAALLRDLVDRDLDALGFEARRQFKGSDGQIDVITGDCPGVRLRALVEALKATGASLPREVVWHIVCRTAELREAWRDAGVEPLDTFVGFDGSLHLFPTLPACWQWEMPSFNADDVFDPLLVDDSIGRLGQLLCATLPQPVLCPSDAEVRALLGRAPPLRRVAEQFLARRVAAFEAIEPAIKAFLGGPPPTGDAAPALASLVQACFPATYARHRHIHESLGCDPAGDGLAREAKILGRVGGPRRTPEANSHADGAWLAYRTTLLAQLDQSHHSSCPDSQETVEALDEPGSSSPDIQPGRSWFARVWSRLRTPR